MRNYAGVIPFQIEKDCQNRQDPSSPKMIKSSSLRRGHGFHDHHPADSNLNSQESQIQSTPSEQLMENGMSLHTTESIPPCIKRQHSLEKGLPGLLKIEVRNGSQSSSNDPGPESPISPFLTSDPQNERSHSRTFNRPPENLDDYLSTKHKYADVLLHHKSPSFWRLFELNLAEWLYALLGSTGAAIFGSFNPILAFTISLVVVEYYAKIDSVMQQNVNRWCLLIACTGIVTVLANFLQHFYFGIMGEKMTERVRRMMFSGKLRNGYFGLNKVLRYNFRLQQLIIYFFLYKITAMLRNEVGWFDDEENCAETLSMRLANDATFVRAAFSNRLSILIQDTAAVIAALLIGCLLQWRLALVALATIPVLIASAFTQVGAQFLNIL